jgi:hypothetical protein
VFYDAGAVAALPFTAGLTAWGNAWLGGGCGLGAATSALERWSPSVETAYEPLPTLLLRLRADGAQRLRLVLPAAGDVRGLPASGAFAEGAIDAGNGMLALGAGQGVIAAVEQRGNALEGTTPVVVLTSLSSPEPLGLPVEVGEATQALRDVAREVTRELHDISFLVPRSDRGEMPAVRAPDMPLRAPSSALALAQQADRFAAALQQIAESGTDTHTTWEDQARGDALRRLTAVVRQARAAAWNAAA